MDSRTNKFFHSVSMQVETKGWMLIDSGIMKIKLPSLWQLCSEKHTFF